ncbi:MAG: TIGR03862 family flavoprotein [Pseudomonadota bacterium]
MSRALVIGAGPAGLMAAEVLGQAGLQVTLADAKPSVGRKFLMAGKSGLNLTKAEAEAPFMAAFAEAEVPLRPILSCFDAVAVQDWARGLGQEVFTGSTGRVFPSAMKASPLLRAWLARLGVLGVAVQTRWHWRGWEDDRAIFDTPDGRQDVCADATVLALGGASWSRLGATGDWSKTLAHAGVTQAPFAPANAAVAVNWSAYMAAHFGMPLKAVAWRAGPYASKGEATISARGLEGGGIYMVSRGVREGHPLMLDLAPQRRVDAVRARLAKPRGKASLSNHLRKAIGLSPAHSAVLQEMARPLPQTPETLAALVKAVPIRHAGLRPMDEAISTAGGVRFAEVDQSLMLKVKPGVFVAGEMLDWEAPTGGYLISACLATGRWAGQHAAAWACRA